LFRFRIGVHFFVAQAILAIGLFFAQRYLNARREPVTAVEQRAEVLLAPSVLERLDAQ
jgi:hypothetical protein